jgi:hypothetical protein
MHIHEITQSIRPKSVHVSGTEAMIARAEHHKTSHWVALGEIRDGWFDVCVMLFFNGPDAAEKAERVASAINAALATTPAIQLTAGE